MLCPGCREAVSDRYEMCPHCSCDLGQARREQPDERDPENISRGPALDQHVDTIVIRSRYGPAHYILWTLGGIALIAVSLQGRRMWMDMNATRKAIADAQQSAAQPAPPPAPLPAPAPAPVAPAPPPEPPPPPPSAVPNWVFDVRVYDLLNFKPVNDASITFLGEDGEQGAARTDASGHFRVKLPATRRGGYRVVVDHVDYAEDHFDDPAANYRKQSLAQRAALRNKVPKHSPWKGGAEPVRREIALFPLVPDR